MNLISSYLGIPLKNPLVASASPLSQSLDNLRRMEDSGLAAVVLYSLFEEQLNKESMELNSHLLHGVDSFSEAQSFFPNPQEFHLGPDEYLDHISSAKKALHIPVIASLNAHSPGSWVEYAQLMEKAGADAIELNIYFLPTSLDCSGETVENQYLEIIKTVKSQVSIPISVKIGPFFSSIANMASKIECAGADGLVLFNRFYQPDIDLENLEVVPSVILSTPMAMRLPLRWIAILFKRTGMSLAGTGGIHYAHDALKMIMAGADVAMLCSVLYKRGLAWPKEMLALMSTWLEEHEYESVAQMKGCMSHRNCEKPEAFERANYVNAVKSDTFVAKFRDS